jgi:hypothetical protein
MKPTWSEIFGPGLSPSATPPPAVPPVKPPASPSRTKSPYLPRGHLVILWNALVGVLLSSVAIAVEVALEQMILPGARKQGNLDATLQNFTYARWVVGFVLGFSMILASLSLENRGAGILLMVVMVCCFVPSVFAFPARYDDADSDAKMKAAANKQAPTTPARLGDMPGARVLGGVGLLVFIAVLHQASSRCGSPELATGFGVLMGAWIATAATLAMVPSKSDLKPNELPIVAGIAWCMLLGCWVIQLVLVGRLLSRVSALLKHPRLEDMPCVVKDFQ